MLWQVMVELTGVGGGGRRHEVDVGEPRDGLLSEDCGSGSVARPRSGVVG